MKFSNGLFNLLSPLTALLPLPATLATAIRKAGKRGAGSYYPTDLKRVTVILETVSDITGRLFEVEVVNGDFGAAIDTLRACLIEEENGYVFAGCK